MLANGRSHVHVCERERVVRCMHVNVCVFVCVCVCMSKRARVRGMHTGICVLVFMRRCLCMVVHGDPVLESRE